MDPNVLCSHSLGQTYPHFPTVENHIKEGNKTFPLISSLLEC